MPNVTMNVGSQMQSRRNAGIAKPSRRKLRRALALLERGVRSQAHGEKRNGDMNVELVEFTRQALATGIERKEIADTLRRAGWAEYDVKAAMDAFVDVAFPVPVPRPKPYLSAREGLVYLILSLFLSFCFFLSLFLFFFFFFFFFFFLFFFFFFLLVFCLFPFFFFY